LLEKLLLDDEKAWLWNGGFEDIYPLRLFHGYQGKSPYLSINLARSAIDSTGSPVAIHNATNRLNNIMMQKTPVATDELVAQQEQPFPKQES